ncbi:MAG TPA: DNA-formamidopyrimidine glycosylase [Gemmatimonadales bacterium]|nr:DNA-formamidopyrimidine glycosylase [Gemmatimonadales bacterium]
MPELPEVETIVRDLRPALLGRTVERASLAHTDVLRGVTRPTLIRGLRGARIDGLFRRAKHAVFELGRRRLVVQPGMTGALVLHDAPLDAEGSRYAVLQALLDDGRTLVYRDVRRLGTLLWLDPRGWDRYDAAIGPEPLDEAFTAKALRAAAGKTRQCIKKALMDQRLLAGVGNIYANEALFAAGIDPSRESVRLGEGEWTALHRELRRILSAAVSGRGSTVRDYTTGTGGKGSFQLSLLAYGREGEPCVRCGTTLAGTHALDARITIFCHRCQT